jgi:hypothetical protein
MEFVGMPLHSGLKVTERDGKVPPLIFKLSQSM